MQRQRFITTIKNVTKEKIKLRSLFGFHSASKIDSYSEGKDADSNDSRKTFIIIIF